MIKERNLDPSLRAKINDDAIARTIYCLKSSGAAYDYWRSRVPAGDIENTIALAYAKVVTGRNDVVQLSPDSHSQAAAITWAKNMTHLVGMYPASRMNQRSRIGHSVTLATMLTVSGYGNLFENLYFMYGLNNATDLNLMTVSGDRNSFSKCHFGGPMNATPADEAGYDLIRLNCGEVFFEDCTFGVQTIAWTDGDMVRFYGPADRSVRAVFENCNFLMNADNAQVNFLECTAGQGTGFAIFKNCQFINQGTSLTYAIDGTGSGNFKMYFDINCSFSGVDDIVALAHEANVRLGHGGYVSADLLNNGLSTQPDVS